jgi:hypothetical protein
MAGVWLLAGAAACSNASEGGGATGPEQDIKASSPAPPASGGTTDAARDTKLVGKWSTDGADHLLFHSLALNSDGTFSAVGGCKPNTDGKLNCFAIVLIQGTWKTSASPEKLTLVDQSARATDLFYSLKGDTVSFSTEQSGAKSTFKKQPDPRIAAGQACKDGDTCVDGFECRSNCPVGAMCLISFNVCQPKLLAIKEGGICGQVSDVRGGGQCAAGLTCKSNCPEGAKCIVEIDTCQKE